MLGPHPSPLRRPGCDCRGAHAPSPQRTKPLITPIPTRAALARVTGSFLALTALVGLSVGGAYLAGSLARASVVHAKIERLAGAARQGFSDNALEAATAHDDSALAIARRFDNLSITAPTARQDRVAAFATGLEARRDGAAPATGLLKASFTAPAPRPSTPPASPFNLRGALDESRDLECLSVNRRVERFAWRRAEKVAAQALDGTVMGQVGTATHFHVANLSPAWGPRLLRVAQVGAHVFYRFGGRNGSNRAFSETPAPSEPLAPVVPAAQQPVYASLALAPIATSVATSVAEVAAAGAELVMAAAGPKAAAPAPRPAIDLPVKASPTAPAKPVAAKPAPILPTPAPVAAAAHAAPAPVATAADTGKPAASAS
ncbi:MAG: hypothetical protein B7Y99_10255 [Caulobacterales bacterium 32-69-10]|nr:MAG: hypothetical protein B7Y99_10255 [Caulobacterales bacterium 32-69-10]